MNQIITQDNRLVSEVESQLIDYERQIKELEDKANELKKSLKEQMEENGIIKIETDNILINLVKGTERETFNKKKFQEENRELYDQYVEFKPTADSLRVKVK